MTNGTRAGEVIHNVQGFQEFWAAYPLRVGRLPAIKVWNKLKPDSELVEHMLRAIEQQKRSRQWQQGFVPHPKTWLYGERWTDEMLEPVSRRSVAPSYQWTCPHTPKCGAPSVCDIQQRIEQGRAERARQA